MDKSHAGWASCDNAVGSNFHLALDQVGQTWLYVSQLLERGVRILNYAGESCTLCNRVQTLTSDQGTYDFICNHVGNEMWMERLEWSGKREFNKQELAEWKVDDEVAGSYKSYKNLSVSRANGLWVL